MYTRQDVKRVAAAIRKEVPEAEVHDNGYYGYSLVAVNRSKTCTHVVFGPDFVGKENPMPIIYLRDEDLPALIEKLKT